MDGGAWSRLGSVLFSAAAKTVEHDSHAPRSPGCAEETGKAGGTARLLRASCPRSYSARDGK